MLDKLAGEGRRSDYLVHPAKQDREATDPDYPYPAGAERKDINAAFEKFVANMAHKATEADAP
jgi:Large polyvalent protein-associated domain 1